VARWRGGAARITTGRRTHLQDYSFSLAGLLTRLAGSCPVRALLEKPHTGPRAPHELNGAAEPCAEGELHTFPCGASRSCGHVSCVFHALRASVIEIDVLYVACSVSTQANFGCTIFSGAGSSSSSCSTSMLKIGSPVTSSYCNPISCESWPFQSLGM